MLPFYGSGGLVAGSGGRRPRRLSTLSADYLRWLMLGLLGLACAVQAQVGDVRFDRLSIDEGLSQNTVTAILQDRIGFIWLGTQEGLNRYDGRNFVIYQHQHGDADSLPNNSIRALAETETGDIWVGTEGGLALWRRASDSFTTYRHDPADPASLASNQVRTLLLDRADILWVGTDRGLARFDPSGPRFELFRHAPGRPDSLSDDRITALVEDREGDLWVGTLSGLNRLDSSSRTFERFVRRDGSSNGLANNRIRSLLEDSEGRLWVGTMGGGLHWLDRCTTRFVGYRHDPDDPRSLSNDLVRVLWQDNAGRLWIGTDQGLNVLERSAEAFIRYQHQPADPYSLSQNRIVTIYQDRAGVLWVGTQSGLHRSDPRTWAFNHYQSPIHLANNDVLALAEGREGELWVGTLNGLDRLDRITNRPRTYRHDPEDPRSLAGNRVSALLEDRSGVLWVGTMDGGLHRYSALGDDFDRFQHQPGRRDSLSINAVTSLLETESGDLWIGTFGGGLHRFDRTTQSFERFRFEAARDDSLSHDRVTCLAEDAFGRLFIGTKAGLNRLDPERASFERFFHVDEDDRSLSHSEVSTLLYDSSRRALWIGTHGGLNRLDHLGAAPSEVSFRRYSPLHGFPSSVISGILPARSGQLWISTNHGLVRFDPESERAEVFDSGHGLRSSDFVLRAAHAGRDGELFFGTFSGVIAFFPELVETNPHVPPVVLTGVSKMNDPMTFDRPVFDVESITFGPRETFFSFEFAALDYSAPQKNQYRYYLEGFQKGWVSIGSESRASFTNLDPGHYTLRVQGSNNDGVFNEEGLKIGIHIRPPFWRTWWFKAAGLIGLLGAVFAGYEIRVRQIRGARARLQRLVDDRTRELREAQGHLLRKERLAVLGELAGSVAHELRNPLGAIKNSVHFLHLTQKQIDDRGVAHLERMEKDIDRSDAIITELLDYARAPSADKKRLALQEMAGEALAELEVPAHVRVERRFELHPLVVEVDPRHIRQIMSNLLTNALQAMPEGGSLRVECRRRGTAAVAAFVDSGVGIAVRDVPKVFEPLFTTKTYGIGLGLALSQRYARLNQGRLTVKSTTGEGTTFELALPLVNTTDGPRDREERTSS